MGEYKNKGHSVVQRPSEGITQTEKTPKNTFEVVIGPTSPCSYTVCLDSEDPLENEIFISRLPSSNNQFV